MSHTTIVVVAVIVLVALLVLFYLLRGRKQHVGFDAIAPVPQRMAPPAPAAPDPLARAVAPGVEGHGVGSEVTAAVEDVIDQFCGIDAHPSGLPPASSDALTRLKGLGPRAASRLNELGVTRFEQIAGWDETDVAAIDRQMGAFQGRIVRDRWVEQARLLASGDRDAFEAQFGKLGD